jgi:hypothetical protein
LRVPLAVSLNNEAIRVRAFRANLTANLGRANQRFGLVLYAFAEIARPTISGCSLADRGIGNSVLSGNFPDRQNAGPVFRLNALPVRRGFLLRLSRAQESGSEP